MDKFTILTGIAAPLMRLNVDTDAIIPSREMKLVSKQGLADGMFAGWRYIDPATRRENPDFILNRPPYRHAPILLTGTNFGCGSSREHAVWALREYGIRCIIAPSFGMIFRSNCIRNGLLPVTLPEETVRDMAAGMEERPAERLLTVNLVSCTVTDMDGQQHAFTLAPADREMLLEGLDEIGLTLKHKYEIDEFESGYKRDWPWLFSEGTDA